MHFGAQLRGLRAPCERFAPWVTPGPRITRFRLAADLGRMGLDTHRVSNKVSKITSRHLVPLDRAFPAHALLHESSLARTMPTDRILTCRCDMTLVGRTRSSDIPTPTHAECARLRLPSSRRCPRGSQPGPPRSLQPAVGRERGPVLGRGRTEQRDGLPVAGARQHPDVVSGVGAVGDEQDPVPVGRPAHGPHELYIDFDGFFAACEEQADRRLQGQPLGVIPFAGAVQSCVIASNTMAKRAGVTTGMAIADARRRCPGIALVPQQPDLYTRIHHRIVAAVLDVLAIVATAGA